MRAATIFETHPLNIVMSSGIERKGGALCVEMVFTQTLISSKEKSK